MIKILLVDDNFIIREGIKGLLSEESSINFIAEASNGLEAIKLLESESPDLILMDINMPEIDGIEATAIIKKDYPHINILILSMHNNKVFVDQAFKAGATGYVLKNSRSEELLHAIRTAACGVKYIDSEITLSIEK